MAEQRRGKMSDDELVKILRHEITKAEGYDSDNLAENREQALNYYYGRKRGDEVTGRSQVQSLDVADMVEAVMSEIMPSIENDDLAVFAPLDASDVDQAQIESDAVNTMIMGSNDGYMLFESAFHDALLLRNGWGKVWIDEHIESQTHTFNAIDPLVAVELASSQDPNTEIEIISQEESDEGEDLIDLQVRITITRRKLRVSPVDPTLMLWEENHDTIDLEGIRFVAERDFPTRTELINQGHDKDKVYSLTPMTLDVKNDSQARNRNEGDTMQAEEPSMDMVERYTCYIMVDFDGDGVAELRECEIVETTLLSNEPVDVRPYATGSPLPQPHRLNGLSIFDKLKETQDIKTSAWRNWLDNGQAVNWGRAALRDGAVNLDDYTNARPGGGIRCEDPNSDIVWQPIIDIGSSQLSILEYADKMRSERGGAALDLQSAEAQIAGDTAHGVERQYSAREKLAGRMSRNLAKTLVKQLFLLVHEMMRTQLQGTITIMRSGQFEQVQPSQWQKRDNVIVKTGMTLAERNQHMNALAAIYQEQKQLIMAGQEGIMVTMDQAHDTLKDMARSAGVDNPERYWLDPSSPQAQQRAAENAQAEQQAQQAQQAQTQQLLQTQMAIEEIKARTDMFEARLKALVDLIKVNAENEQTEAKIVADSVTQLEVAAQGANGEQRTEGSTATG